MNSVTTAAIEITGIGMAGIFVFMIIFYFAIKLIDKSFPVETTNEAEGI